MRGIPNLSVYYEKQQSGGEKYDNQFYGCFPEYCTECSLYLRAGNAPMEAAGAAMATALSRVIELLWVLAELAKKDRVKIRFCYIFHPDKALRKDFWHYTLPVLGNELVWGGGFTMYSVIMGHLGSDAVAANSIANIVKNLITSLAHGIGNGGSILVGNELGKPEIWKQPSSMAAGCVG